ncbi:MAG: polyphosphate kinase 1, partial [Bacteroidales bacterium]|nr:polyphosphate kinase 1 [Bacteroidales bacterium]
LGIYSNNNDEFFRVRVAVLSRLLRINEQQTDRSKRFTEYDVESVYSHVMELQHVLQVRFQKAWDTLKTELSAQQIFLVNERSLTREQKAFVKEYFLQQIRPHLFPILLSKVKVDSADFIRDNSVYLAVDLFSSRKELKERYALIEIPSDKFGRFLLLPSSDSGRYIMFLDDVIRFCLTDIFGVFGYDKFSAYTIKITRDAELDIDHDISRSFMELMEQSVKRRAQGLPVRFIYDSAMPENLLTAFSQKLKLTKKANFFPGGRYHNFRDLMNFPDLGLKFEPLPPLPAPSFPEGHSIFKSIAQKDVLLHYPYHSFDSFINLLREASLDPKVRTIKITLYRVAKHSNVINALINAARNGKQVTVFFEFQARFDEETNIYYTNILQHEGVKVISSIPGYKVHSKILLIRRKEMGKDQYYAVLGTGNFNEATAKVYTDVILFTANQAITAEVNRVFYLFEQRFLRPVFRHLIVSPFQHREFICNAIDNEIANARAGNPAWVKVKLNSLVDERVVEKIREGAREGVKFQLLIRGICVIIPTRREQKNIAIISIVDRFLEHSRLLLFCNNGQTMCYISSADWMKRNLDHRIEVSCPVFDPGHIQTLHEVFDISWNDNVKARVQDGSGKNIYRKRDEATVHRSQWELYHYFAQKK